MLAVMHTGQSKCAQLSLWWCNPMVKVTTRQIAAERKITFLENCEKNVIVFQLIVGVMKSSFKSIVRRNIGKKFQRVNMKPAVCKLLIFATYYESIRYWKNKNVLLEN